MRFRKIAVASLCIFFGLFARAEAASPEALVAAIQKSETHSSALTGLNPVEQIETVCLAMNLYHEVRGSTERDILGVALVTHNRIKQSRKKVGFCDIIWEKGQYTWTIRSVTSLWPKEHGSWHRMVGIASDFVRGEVGDDFTNGANTFYSKKLGIPRWTAGGTGRQTIGAHVYVYVPR